MNSTPQLQAVPWSDLAEMAMDNVKLSLALTGQELKKFVDLVLPPPKTPVAPALSPSQWLVQNLPPSTPDGMYNLIRSGDKLFLRPTQDWGRPMKAENYILFKLRRGQINILEQAGTVI